MDTPPDLSEKAKLQLNSEVEKLKPRGLGCGSIIAGVAIGGVTCVFFLVLLGKHLGLGALILSLAIGIALSVPPRTRYIGIGFILANGLALLGLGVCFNILKDL
ncbi:hypothetical protein [Actomonas aquatica]|uniref:DUF4190 domain-containing protein n=1 Tax=Actomonas aquatica TaxID=2866162 RepID=A0ABZ1CE60_9BACT|nr:hypothetical protein [Opitutus sp. WL0086]WRQ89716.1 hypothetical protein K1X11_009880 [Opitutus sp. WL0086]